MFLQISTTEVADTASQAANGQEHQTMFSFLIEGGIFMIPLVILSVMAVYIFVERFLTIKKASKISYKFMDEVKTKVLAGDIDGAKLLCSKWNSPVSRMIDKGISRIGNSLKNIEASIENVGKIEIYNLEKNLSLLATISGAAPMIGFLGTVTGMIKAFTSIAKIDGAVSPKHLSVGISEAMITTAAGLIIGIIAYLGYNYLVNRLQKVIHKMEYSSIEFIDLLQEPQ